MNLDFIMRAVDTSPPLCMMADGRRMMEDGRWKKAERRLRAEGRWKKAEGRWKMLLPRPYCIH